MVWITDDSGTETFKTGRAPDVERCRKSLPREIGTQLVAPQLGGQKAHGGIQYLLAVSKSDRDMTLTDLLH